MIKRLMGICGFWLRCLTGIVRTCRTQRWGGWLVLALLAGCSTSRNSSPIAPLWSDYKSRYVLSEGRVVDSGNNHVSHSEGQGYAMLLAIANNDRRCFDRLWRWTQTHLQVRDDRLFAWHWQSARPHINDHNNAADGDLLIAWALLRAGQTWQDAGLLSQSSQILRDIRQKLVRPSAIGPVLLPGAYGFETSAESLLLNPSYWVYPALRDIADYEPAEPVWRQLQHSGLQLLQVWQQAGYRLPPDWIVLNPHTGSVSIDASKPARFGFEAVRVPLYLCWIGQCQNAVLDGVAEVWQQPDPPAWLEADQSQYADFVLSAGGKSVRDLLQSQRGGAALSLPSTLPKESDYYSSSLLILAQLAVQKSE